MEGGIVAQWLPSHAAPDLPNLNLLQELAWIREIGMAKPHPAQVFNKYDNI